MAGFLAFLTFPRHTAMDRLLQPFAGAIQRRLAYLRSQPPRRKRRLIHSGIAPTQMGCAVVCGIAVKPAAILRDHIALTLRREKHVSARQSVIWIGVATAFHAGIKQCARARATRGPEGSKTARRYDHFHMPRASGSFIAPFVPEYPRACPASRTLPGRGAALCVI